MSFHATGSVLTSLLLIQTLLVLTTSPNTTKSGGALLDRLLDGCMKTSSGTPRAL